MVITKLNNHQLCIQYQTRGYQTTLIENLIYLILQSFIMTFFLLYLSYSSFKRKIIRQGNLNKLFVDISKIS